MLPLAPIQQIEESEHHAAQRERRDRPLPVPDLQDTPPYRAGPRPDGRLQVIGCIALVIYFGALIAVCLIDPSNLAGRD